MSFAAANGTMTVTDLTKAGEEEKPGDNMGRYTRRFIDAIRKAGMERDIMLPMDFFTTDQEGHR